MKHKQHETINHDLISKVTSRVFIQLTLILHCPVTHCCDTFKGLDFTVSLHQSLQLSAFHCVKKKFSQNKKPGASCRILEPLTGRLQWGFLNQSKISISFQKIKDTRLLENGFSFPETCFYAHSNPYTKGVLTALLWDLATAALLVSTKVIKRLYKRARKRKA